MTLLTELKKYSHDVINGKVIACTKHKWACQRFLNDLTRSKKKDKDFPYVFDEQKANRFLRWMSLFKHKEGVLSGQNIKPHIIQKFIFGNIYGWVHKGTGYRRFTKAYWQVGRKNAKSQSLACVATYEQMALDESGHEKTEIYIAATKKEQASIVYDLACDMLKDSDFFKNKNIFKIAYGKIVHNKTGSIIKPLSKEDRKTGDGLNPQCGIIDEYHAHETTEIHDIVDSGMGARKQPLLIIITTAGFDLNNPCYRIEYDLVSKILNPDIPIELDYYFVMINEIETDKDGNIVDDINDPKVWEKANPIICSYKEGREKLKKDKEEADISPEKSRNFLTKRLNVWIMAAEQGYMNMMKWAQCCVKENFPDLTGLPTIPGFDLSSRIDLCSTTFLTLLDSGIIAVTSHSFMPDDMIDAKEKLDKMPYKKWVRDGWITATPGSEVDYHYILEYVEKLWEKMKWKKDEACYDKYLATWLTHEMQETGFEAVEIPQSYTGLSEATKDFRGRVLNKRVIHNNNPVLTWSVSNAIIRIGPSENIMLDKAKSRQRIDPIAAAINAHTRVMFKDPQKHVYRKRGVRSLA